jgi:hypothetical protein
MKYNTNLHVLKIDDFRPLVGNYKIVIFGCTLSENMHDCKNIDLPASIYTAPQLISYYPTYKNKKSPDFCMPTRRDYRCRTNRISSIYRRTNHGSNDNATVTAFEVAVTKDCFLKDDILQLSF